jgi:hypothetical protein
VNDLFESVLGRTLYWLLPAIYRERDNNVFDAVSGRILAAGDLALYLDASGILLDRIRATLEQRLADAFPDAPAEGDACQEWLIPYFARLLDVRLVAPDVAGQRAEVANAIAWRQRKGTLLCAEQIGEAILQREVELQEGWQRVALTPRVGTALLPESVYGVQRHLRTDDPLDVARHPGLPVATVDLRCPSRAARTTRASPAVRTSRLGGLQVPWMQANRSGAPTHPGGFDDVSRRTVDLRTPRWNAGHYHPRRLLVYATPPMGLFAPRAITLEWQDALASPWLSVTYNPENRHLHMQNRSSLQVTVSGDADLLTALPPSILAKLVADHEPESVPLVTIENLQFAGQLTLARGRLRASGAVVASLDIGTNYYTEPVLDATDCLFGTVSAPDGLVRFESCTVLATATCGQVGAANSIFAGSLTGTEGGQPPLIERIHHTRVPADLLAAAEAEGLAVDHCTAEAPVFFVPAGAGVAPQAVVLSPAAPGAICVGAEDGAEMGFFHRGREGRPVHLPAGQSISGISHDYELKDIVFAGALAVLSGEKPLRLRRCAASSVSLAAPAREQSPQAADQLIATGCLFGNLAAEAMAMQLEYCTVFGRTRYGRLHASDCIFAGTLERSPAGGGPEDDCIRFSCVPAENLDEPLRGQRFASCTSEPPVFIEPDFARGAAGDAGCGVLHPAVPQAVANGAEDGGEVGAYHASGYRLQDAALRDKLADHLPVGIEAVLVQDPQMNTMPPAAIE